MNPEISIVLPVYNGAAFLREAIDSALAQTCRDFEIIVVNDGSTDDGQTEAIAKSYDAKIRYFSKPHSGIASALNVGIQNMRGEWFAWLSQDDRFSSNRLETDLALVRQIPDARIIFCRWQTLAANGTVSPRIDYPDDRITNPRQALIVGGVGVYLGAATIHRSCFAQVGGFDESYRSTQDVEMAVRLSRTFVFHRNPDAFVSRRDSLGRDARALGDLRKKDLLRLADVFHNQMTLRDFFPNLGEDEKELASAWRWMAFQYNQLGSESYARECSRKAILVRKNLARRWMGIARFDLRQRNDPRLKPLIYLGEGTYSLLTRLFTRRDPFSTHLPLLELLVKELRPRSVWEFGMGMYSTGLFVEQCAQVVSVEMQDEDWYQRIISKWQRPNFQPMFILGPMPACDYLASLECTFDLIFVDGHPDSRFAAANVSFAKTNVIVLHDTETLLYHWEDIRLPKDWVWIDFVELNPWTSILVHGAEMSERICKLGARFKPTIRKT